MEIGVGRVHNPRMDSSDLSECGRLPVHDDKRQYLVGFVSQCRAIKSLDFDLMKNAESRPRRPLNAGTSSRSTPSNNFKFGDPRGQRNLVQHEGQGRANAPITTLRGNILVHRVPSDTLDVVSVFGYFADAYAW